MVDAPDDPPGGVAIEALHELDPGKAAGA